MSSPASILSMIACALTLFSGSRFFVTFARFFTASMPLVSLYDLPIMEFVTAPGAPVVTVISDVDTAASMAS